MIAATSSCYFRNRSLSGNSYFPLPKELRNPVRLANIQNEDNECLKLCLLRYLNRVNKKPTKFRNVYKEFAVQLNFEGVKFPVHKKDHGKIEKQNNISINVLIKHHTVSLLQNKL